MDEYDERVCESTKDLLPLLDELQQAGHPANVRRWVREAFNCVGRGPGDLRHLIRRDGGHRGRGGVALSLVYLSSGCKPCLSIRVSNRAVRLVIIAAR